MHLQVGFLTAALGVVVVPTSLFLLVKCGCQCLFYVVGGLLFCNCWSNGDDGEWGNEQVMG